MSVRRAQLEIDSQEFAEWMAYSALEPFGPERDDERAGAIAATIANVYRDSSKRSDPFGAWDFFPRHPVLAGGDTPDTKDSAPDLAGKLMAWAAAMGDNDTGQKGRSQLRPRKTGTSSRKG